MGGLGGRLGGYLGRLGDVLGGLGGDPGVLEASWRHLGGVLEASWDVLGRLGSILGRQTSPSMVFNSTFHGLGL